MAPPISLCCVLYAFRCCARSHRPQHPQQRTWCRAFCYYDVLWASGFLTSLWGLVRPRPQKALDLANTAISSVLSVFPFSYRRASILQVGTIFWTVIWIWCIRSWYIYPEKKKLQEITPQLIANSLFRFVSGNTKCN